MTDPNSIELTKNVVAGLRRLGYSNALLQENYTFSDWFAHTNEERTLAAAAFGQTPISYDSALIGVAQANGLRARPLVDSLRALGAPILLEVDGLQLHEWAVARNQNEHILIGTYSADRVQQLFVERAPYWEPESFLRSKSIGSFQWQRQLDLFVGLLPELEEQIQGKLDPLLREALATVSRVYLDTSGLPAKPENLFKLIFWILTAKVFFDRKVQGFDSLGSDPDELLSAVAHHYRVPTPKLLNRAARTAAAEKIWTDLDFRNLSVDVLSQIWSTTLVDRETRKRLGIHRTPRTIVRYIVERTPFAMAGDDPKIVFEPCCGSASFLIGAMNHLRARLFGTSPEQRHSYFVQHLAGMEREPFGVEISKLALALGDFPNPNGWTIEPGDAFLKDSMADYLRRAGVVLCNPPFEDFKDDQRERYELRSVKKPAELLYRILDHLHPQGVLGFVLPRNFIDGQGYCAARKLLAERFAHIELTILPDRAFVADAEVVLLIATEAIPHTFCRVSSRKVNDDPDSWERFARHHQVSSEQVVHFSPDQAASGLMLPDLPAVWDYLSDYQTLGAVTETISRGIRWKEPMLKKRRETGNRELFVKEKSHSGYIPGVAPRTKFRMYEVPKMKFLSIREEHRDTSAWKLPWQNRKVILNKSAKSRGRWRMSAFADEEGVTCYQTYLAIWPKTQLFDEVVLAAVINSPIASAFVSAREGKTDITIETIREIPMPVLSKGQRDGIRSLVSRYEAALQRGLFRQADEDPNRLLKQIDAAILDGYRLPPRLEREVLEYFRGYRRPTVHPFTDYVPKDCDLAFSLSRYLSPQFGGLTAKELLSKIGNR